MSEKVTDLKPTLGGESLGLPSQQSPAPSWCPVSPELRKPQDLEALKDTLQRGEPAGAAQAEACRAEAEAAVPCPCSPACTTPASAAPLGGRRGPGTVLRGPDPSQLSSDLIW